MLQVPLDFLLYYSLLLLVNGVCWYRYKLLRFPDNLLCFLLLITLIEEPASYVMMKAYKNNLPVYHIYGPIEFALISLYFNYSIRNFRRNRLGLIIGLAGVIFSIVNTIFLQKPRTINSYFLMFEGTAIIIYCLISFHQILLEEEELPYRFALFWIAICLVLYWSTTFTGWGIYAAAHSQVTRLNILFTKMLEVVNYLFYAGLLLIFLRYKKLIPSGVDI